MGRPFPTTWARGRGVPCLAGDMDTVLCDYTDAQIKTLNGIYGDESLLPFLPSMCPPPSLYLSISAGKPTSLPARTPSLSTQGMWGTPDTTNQWRSIAETRSVVPTDDQPKLIYTSRQGKGPTDSQPRAQQTRTDQRFQQRGHNFTDQESACNVLNSVQCFIMIYLLSMNNVFTKSCDKVQPSA